MCEMNAFSRSKLILPLVSVLALAAFSAHAEEPAQQPVSRGTVQGSKPPEGAAHSSRPVQGRPSGPVVGRGPQDAHRGAPDARMARGAMPARNFGGHPYRGHLAWEGGRWHHEVHNGRDGWWWDVGGVWYFYPQPMEGPPTYVSEDYADDVGDPYGPPVADGYAPPPPGAYAPPPPPPPDPAASAVGGAIVGGLLGGLLTGHASGAAAGAIAGGATGAIVGAQAASRPGYYLAQGNCYYRYPSGQYVQADPRACY
jgi:hypothetical protein